jgi:hypothetical protein
MSYITTLRQLVPTFAANARHSVLVDFGGTAYQLEFWYNGRGQYWSLTLRDAAGTALLSGRKLVNNWLPVFRFPQARPPYGELSTFGDTDIDAPMTQAQLGTGMFLRWLSLEKLPLAAAP